MVWQVQIVRTSGKIQNLRVCKKVYGDHYKRCALSINYSEYYTCLEWQLTDELGRVWSTKTESWQPEVDEFAWWPPPEELEAKSLIFISSSTSLCFRCFSTCWSKISPLEGVGIEPKDGAPAAAPGLRTKLFCLTIATLEDTVNICGMKVKCKQHKRENAYTNRSLHSRLIEVQFTTLNAEVD